MSSGTSNRQYYILGAGRVGGALARLLADKEMLAGVWTRSGGRAERLASSLEIPVDHGAIPEVTAEQTLLLCVPDGAIRSVLQAHPNRKSPKHHWLHVSGSAGMSVYQKAGIGGLGGVCHPLYSFRSTVESRESLAGTIFAIKGHKQAVVDGFTLAHALGCTPVSIDGADEVGYHLAATLASNGVYALLEAAGEVLRQAGIEDARVVRGLAQLAAQSAENAAEKPPKEGMEEVATGPVMRGDAATVQSHRRWYIENRHHGSELYDAMSEVLLRVAERGEARDGLLSAVATVLAESGESGGSVL